MLQQYFEQLGNDLEKNKKFDDTQVCLNIYKMNQERNNIPYVEKDTFTQMNASKLEDKRKSKDA